MCFLEILEAFLEENSTVENPIIITSDMNIDTQNDPQLVMYHKKAILSNNFIN